ncbi:hypothetical protein BCR43DRAFT_497167 [Syncephalastrum racemosum]|uniref:C2H2-type domain-containing protein n=1 Tax=Syncephalastrum racemosum TaxID=13706 RepID=A0A1X2H584_SYNRA|nr:hypothetical protein BCR43DRAFT_497167 [Syncephalastrum racemosum]
MLFDTYNARRKHWRVHREHKETFDCKEKTCSKLQFKSKYSLDTHILACHTEPPKRDSLSCQYEGCVLEFRTNAELKDHQVKYHGRKITIKKLYTPILCEIDGCKKVFKYYKSYQKHVDGHCQKLTTTSA